MTRRWLINCSFIFCEWSSLCVINNFMYCHRQYIKNSLFLPITFSALSFCNTCQFSLWRRSSPFLAKLTSSQNFCHPFSQVEVCGCVSALPQVFCPQQITQSQPHLQFPAFWIWWKHISPNSLPVWLIPNPLFFWDRCKSRYSFCSITLQNCAVSSQAPI